MANSNSVPLKPPVVQPSSGNSILVNPCQRLNPLLECIRNVSKEFSDIVPDFQLGRTTCALFLSLKYHRLHPEYVHQRIQRLGSMYTLRVLLVMCDVSEHQEPIRELTKICLLNNITVIVAWSNEEAGAYLAAYKVLEHRPPDLIKERLPTATGADDRGAYAAILRAALTGSVSRVNKMDVETLRTSFGSFSNIARASPERLRSLPGFGPVKVRRLQEAFEKPFRNKATAIASATSTSTGEGADAGAEIGSTALELEAIATSTAVPDSGGSVPLLSALTPPSKSAVRSLEDGMDADSRLAPNSSITSTATAPRRREREPSPVWDIELDLN